MNLENTVSLVMGASAGIGVAVAEALAARGAKIAIAARRRAPLEKLAAKIGALPIVCDVADHVSAAAAVAETVQLYGRLDHLINNAGVIEPIGRIEDCDPTLWARSININLTGTFNAVHAALPHLLKTAGTIVNVSSGAAHRPLEGWSAYCSGKAGLAMLTRALILEYGDKGLKIYGFSPGTVRTQMQVSIRASGINPVSQLDPESLLPPALPAQVIAWLCGSTYPSGEHSIRDPELRAGAGLPPLD
jgi:NAD(P)-dependent dehydrogenase (short-subunit alcohol dehydrogenase family)